MLRCVNSLQDDAASNGFSNDDKEDKDVKKLHARIIIVGHCNPTRFLTPKVIKVVKI